MSTVLSPKRLTRDPFIDLLRTCAILVVACGHWIMPVLQWHGGTLTAGNSLATPGWWLLTWPLQVMPVFFFAGGAANYHSYVRSGDARAWLSARLCRLAVPVLPLLAVWLAAPSLLRAVGVPDQPVALGAGIVGQLLWFLAVYVLTVAVVPLLHKRGVGLAVVFGVAAVGVDALRFHGVPLVGYGNEMLVWLAVSQLGFAYARGMRLTRSAAAGLGCAGFAATVALVLFGHYPDSMVGLPGQVSNMAPATVCLLCLGVGQIGVLLALRESIVRRWGQSRLLSAVGSRCMTVYLWHMPAMVIVAGIAVVGFGYPTPTPGSPLWLVVTPLWIGALALVLSLLVRVFGRFESIRPADGRPSGRRLVAAVVLLCVGFTGVAAFGFASVALAVPWVAAIVAGLAMAWPDLEKTVDTWLAALVDAVFR